MNNFVQVMYRENSTISCVFLNQSDTSEKECCVTYGLCDRREAQHKNTPTCNRNSPYNIQLEVADRSRYCYTITASNESHTVKLEGIFTLGIYSSISNILFSSIHMIVLIKIQVTTMEEIATQLP